MKKDLSDELEEFYNDHDEELNQKNFKLLIDEWEDLDLELPSLETFTINPVLNNDKGLIEIDVKKELKSPGKNNLF